MLRDTKNYTEKKYESMIFMEHYPQLHLSLKCQIRFAFRNTLRLWLTKCYALLVKIYFLLSKMKRPAMLRK